MGCSQDAESQKLGRMHHPVNPRQPAREESFTSRICRLFAVFGRARVAFDLVKKLESEVYRMVRLILHLHKHEGQTHVEWHSESMRRARDWGLSWERVPWPHRILGRCANIRMIWSELEPCTLVGRALRGQSVRCNHHTTCFYLAVSAPRHLATGKRVGRRQGRLEKACVEA